MRGAMLWEKAFRAFEIMPIALEPRLFEAVSDFLIFNDAKRGVGPCFATRRQLFDPLTDLIQNWPFSEPFPGRNQTDCCDGILLSFFRGFEHRSGIDKAVTRSAGCIGGRLRAEAAVFRAAAGLRI